MKVAPRCARDSVRIDPPWASTIERQMASPSPRPRSFALQEHGVFLVLASIEARFHASARLSDMLYVSAAVAEARGARVRFAQQVLLNEPDGELICEGTAEVACKDAERGRPRRLPMVLMSELYA